MTRQNQEKYLKDYGYPRQALKKMTNDEIKFCYKISQDEVKSVPSIGNHKTASK